MPNLLRNSILMILLFCRTHLSCLEAEISVKIVLHSKVPLFHTNALTAVQEDISNLGEAIQTAGDSKHRSDHLETKHSDDDVSLPYWIKLK